MMKNYSFKGSFQESRNNENSQPSSSLIQMKSSCSSQRLEEIRRKYDTPTRRELKEIETRPSYNNGGKQLMVSSKFSRGDENSRRDKWDSKRSMLYNQSPSIKENLKNDEQAVFKKIKEMKESLLGDRVGYEKAKVTKSIYEPNREVKGSSGINDHRIENIDKINSKIQQILNCLKENESKNKTQQVIENQTPISHCRPSSSIVDTKYSNSFQKSSLISSKCIEADKKQTNHCKNYSNYQEKQGFTNIESPLQKKVEGFTLESRREPSKTKSYMDSSFNRNNTKQERYEMSNGKKLDDEISKIQNKIQQFQEEKKKLNIDFKPFSYSNTKSTTDLTRRSYTVDKFKPYNQKYENGNSCSKKFDEKIEALNGRRQEYNKVIERDQSYKASREENYNNNLEINTINVDLPKSSERQFQQPSRMSGFKINLIPVEYERREIQTKKPRTSFESKNIQKDAWKNKRTNEQKNNNLRKKTDENIEKRKRILSYEGKKSDKTIKFMINILKRQAELDQQLRNNKLWFDSCFAKDKWTKLSQQLLSHNMSMCEQKMKQVFFLCDEQNNPFYSVRENGSDIGKLVQSYIESEKHWKESVMHQFSRGELEQEEFKEESLDLQKKGHLVIEDLVRYLNMETGNFYRNRDILLIFRRISRDEKLQFKDLMSILC